MDRLVVSFKLKFVSNNFDDLELYDSFIALPVTHSEMSFVPLTETVSVWTIRFAGSSLSTS